MIRITKRNQGDIVVLDLIGRLTSGEPVRDLREAVRSILDGGARKLALNMEGVSYVDGSGLNELVRIYTSVRNHSGVIHLFCLTEAMHHLLRTTKLFTVFDCSNSEEEALEAMK